jgi:hypothetical protein
MEEKEKKERMGVELEGRKEGEQGCVKGNTGIVASDGVQAFIHGMAFAFRVTKVI